MTKLANPTARANEEWIGAHPDQDIPRRVKARVFARYEGKCAITGKKLRPGEVDFDHITRLRDGGEHRENNLRPVWREAHREKTAQENRDGAKTDRIFAKHHGFFPKPKGNNRLQSRPFPKRWEAR